MIAAILRAQFLSMRLSRGWVFSMLAGVIWYGMWIFVASVIGLGAATLRPAELGHFMPLVLAGVCAYWQLVPLVTAGFGASLDMRKLLPYPIPHAQLFLVEVLLRVTTSIEMLIVLGGGLMGLPRNTALGGIAALPRFALSLLVFVLFNLLLASGLRSILERLLARRKVREVLAVVMTIVWVLPRFLMTNGFHPKSLDGAGAWMEMVALPWTAAARAALGQSPALNLLGLLLWTAAALWFGRTQFERSLRYDAVAAQATPAAPRGKRATTWIEAFFRWPSFLWADPLAGIVEKELRTLARTPRFRMVFVMGCTFGLLVWFPVMAAGRATSSASPYFLTVVSMYALMLLGQVSYWNCFGFDRSAAAFYFAAPQPLSKVLLGKNIAALVYVYLEMTALAVIILALGLAGGWSRILETFLVVGVSALYMLALGNLSSVRYPRASNPERVSQGGTSGRMQGLIFLLFPLTLIPAGFAYLARYAFDSDAAFVVILILAATLGIAVYRMAMESAVRTVTLRREQFIADLSSGEGPVVSGG
jgi:ABC-2 type transport system permease protein